MHVMQMIDSRRWDETHVTVELEKEASSDYLVGTHALLMLQEAQNRTANGRLSKKKRMVAYILTFLTFTFTVMIRRRTFFQENRWSCAIQQNPVESSRAGSSDRSGGCLELRGKWRMRHADELSIFQLNPGQSRVGKGLFNGTDTVAVVASPCSPVKVTGNQVHFLVKHHCANRKDQLFSDATRVTVVDVERHNCE